jgi:hypothetical protein
MPIFGAMRNWFLLLPALALLAACSHQPAVVDDYNVQKDNRYTLVDSAAKTDSFFKYDEYARVALYQVFYIGKAQNNYTLPLRPLSESVRSFPDTGRYTTRYNDKTVSIFVDTALNISKRLEYRHEVTDSVNKVKDMKFFKVDSV